MREKGGRGSASEEGVRGEAEGMVSCPFHMKAAFQMEMAGSAAALGQWSPSLRSPQPQRNGGPLPEEPLSTLPLAWGKARGRGLPGLPTASKAAAKPVAQGLRGMKTGWKNANKMGGGKWEGKKKRERQQS